MKKYLNYLVQWLKEEVKKAEMLGVIIGLSGGIDSSVTAAIAKKAFPNNSLGVYLPIEDMGQDLIDAKYVAKTINIQTRLVDLTEAFLSLKMSVGVKSKLSIANIKPRLRMTALYSLAQEKKYLVLGTDNAAEWMLGYFTKYGDGGVDLLPIIHLSKRDVNKAAKILGLPAIVWNKEPTAGLWKNQTDEKELGFSYAEVDKYLDGKWISKTIKNKIDAQIRMTEHKRKPLPTPNKKCNVF